MQHTDTSTHPFVRMLGSWGLVLVALSSGCHLASCRSSPPIRHYQPEVVQQELGDASSPSDVVLAIEDFSASAAYDEQRIVYRTNDVQINYYHYHRWASPPGLLVSDMLQQVYRQTNRFEAVIGGYDSRADAVLSGRIVKFEEFDNEDEWRAQVVLELRLRGAGSGELLWDEQIERSVVLDEQSPLGLARAMSRALTRIGSETAPTIVERFREAKRKRKSKMGSSGSNSSPSSSEGE